MRKFLSLVLALVMMMSLVTINAGAKEFTDDSDITYQEAVDVISTIKVVDGYDNGSYNPKGNLTRGAAAKIICNLILGPTTAAELHADTAPFRDVPVTHDFAGYIAYCQKEGIISGYADGSFRPAGTLTGYAFMKMLLGALGYDSEIEGFVGPNWSINVAKKAIGIGLNKSLNGEFNGVNYITREEAALYAFNTLRTDLVEYDQKITATVNGAEVTVGNSLAKAQVWNNSLTRHNNIRNDEYIQFAEQYFNKLVLTEAEDAFGRPDREWKFDGDEIGKYVNYDLFKQEYTTEVKGVDLYNLLGSDIVKNYSFEITIDGVDIDGKTGTTDHNTVLKSASNHSSEPYFDETFMAKTFKTKIGETGDGTLTQVFVNNDKQVEKVWVSVINTYLAKATSDYNEKKDEAKLDVYALTHQGSGDANAVYYKYAGACAVNKGQTENLTITSEDFARAADVKKDDIVLVRVANGEIKEILDPEVLSEVSMSKFSKNNYVVSEGTQYDYDTTVDYDPDTLDLYTGEDNNATQQLKDTEYNIYLDPYGYLIGVEIVEAQKNYVFLTGIDQGTSNLNNKTADAAGILTDGTFVNFQMNMKDSKTAGASNANPDPDGASAQVPSPTFFGHALWNTWCTYTVDKNGVYTLKEVGDFDAVFPSDPDAKAAKAGQFADFASSNKEIDHKHVSLTGKGTYNASTHKLTSGGFVYGNDNSIYILAELKEVVAKNNIASTCLVAGPAAGAPGAVGDTAAEVGSGGIDTDNGDTVGIISGVDSIGVGIDNVSLKTFASATKLQESCTPNITSSAFPGYVYTLFDNEGYVIAAVVVGEDTGTNKNLVYSHKGSLESEEYDAANDEWTWTRKVIKDGEEILLTQKGDDSDKYNGLYGMNENVWYEVNMKADDTVKGVKTAYYVQSGKRVGATVASSVATQHSPEGPAMTYAGDVTPIGGGVATYQAGDFVSDITFLESALNDDEKDTTTLYEQVWGIGKGDATIGNSTQLVEKNAPSLIGSTLYVNTDARKGFYVHKDVKSVLIQTNYGDTTTEYGTGTSDLENFLKDLNFDEDTDSWCFKISAILTDGRASVVIIHDWNGAGATTNGSHGSSSSTGTVVSTLPGGGLKVITNETLTARDVANAVKDFLNDSDIDSVSYDAKNHEVTITYKDGTSTTEDITVVKAAANVDPETATKVDQAADNVTGTTGSIESVGGNVTATGSGADYLKPAGLGQPSPAALDCVKFLNALQSQGVTSVKFKGTAYTYNSTSKTWTDASENDITAEIEEEITGSSEFAPPSFDFVVGDNTVTYEVAVAEVVLKTGEAAAADLATAWDGYFEAIAPYVSKNVTVTASADENGKPVITLNGTLTKIADDAGDGTTSEALLAALEAFGNDEGNSTFAGFEALYNLKPGTWGFAVVTVGEGDTNTYVMVIGQRADGAGHGNTGVPQATGIGIIRRISSGDDNGKVDYLTSYTYRSPNVVTFKIGNLK